MNRYDTDITSEHSPVPADETAARDRLERFSRFLAIGAVRAAEGRSPDRDAGNKEGADSNADQSASDANNTSEMSGG